MSRLKLLITNIAFFGGLKVVSSIFPLLILPYITKRIGGAGEFGLYDIFLIITSLSTSVSMFGIQDAMFREYHLRNDEYYRKKVTSTSFILVLVSSLLTGVVLFCLMDYIHVFSSETNRYHTLIYFAASFVIIQNISKISIHPSRLDNNKKHLLFQTLINCVVFYTVALIFLQYIQGLYALIYGHLVAAFLNALCFMIINRKRFFPLCFSKEIARTLFLVGVPLMPLFLIYWANNSVVRLLIARYLGANELGVFAVGSKYASVSSFFQMAFAGGWSYFTYSTMNDADQVPIKSRIFEILLFIIVVSYALITPFASRFFKLFFTGEFVRGYTVFGQLFLSPLFLILYQIIANQFTIAGMSFYSLISLGGGFIFSLLLNYFFLRHGMGIVSLSYSIPIGYLFAIVFSYFFAKRKNLFYIPARVLVSFGFIIVINIILKFVPNLSSFFYSIPIIIIFLFVNHKLIAELFHVGRKITFERVNIS